MKFENSINIQGRDAKSLSVSGTAAVTPTVLEPGVYAVWSTVDTFIKVDQVSTVADDVTVSTGFPIRASSDVIPVRIPSPSFLAAIAGSSGTMYYQRVG